MVIIVLFLPDAGNIDKFEKSYRTLQRLVRFFLCLFIVAGIPVPGVWAGTPVRLVLQWYPQAQFAGFYVAREKGFYTDKGIDLEILPGGADSSPSAVLEQGGAEFGTMFLSTALEVRYSGVDLVNIGQMVHESALMLVARKDSEIRTIQDLNGKRVGMWGPEFQLQPLALFKREGVVVEVVRQSPSFELFMRGGLDAVSAMWYNEYHTLISYGLDQEEMIAFRFSNLDQNLPEDGIYCLAATYEKAPDLAHALVEATARGWEYAFAHPEEALDIVITAMKERKVRANRAHQRWMLARMQDIILPAEQERVSPVLGRETYRSVVRSMLDSGFIRSAPEYETFCRGDAQ